MFSISNQGSIVLVIPRDEATTEWLVENVGPQGPDVQWYGGALVVEPRYLESLVQGLEAAGLG